VAWNGILESVKIAAMADAYEVNVAPHNFNGHLGSLISAHMCAVVPNFKVMEIDIDDVLWKDEIVTIVPVIENGDMLLPTGPGWGPKSMRNSSAPTRRKGADHYGHKLPSPRESGVQGNRWSAYPRIPACAG